MVAWALICTVELALDALFETDSGTGISSEEGHAGSDKVVRVATGADVEAAEETSSLLNGCSLEVSFGFEIAVLSSNFWNKYRDQLIHGFSEDKIHSTEENIQVVLNL